MRARRRGNIADTGTCSRHDARGDPRWDSSERQNGNKEEPATATAAATSTDIATVAYQ